MQLDRCSHHPSQMSGTSRPRSDRHDPRQADHRQMFQTSRFVQIEVSLSEASGWPLPIRDSLSVPGPMSHPNSRKSLEASLTGVGKCPTYLAFRHKHAMELCFFFRLLAEGFWSTGQLGLTSTRVIVPSNVSSFGK